MSECDNVGGAHRGIRPTMRLGPAHPSARPEEARAELDVGMLFLPARVAVQQNLRQTERGFHPFPRRSRRCPLNLYSTPETPIPADPVVTAITAKDGVVLRVARWSAD